MADIPSIIIPSCNAGRQFAGLLESLRGQTTRCEIIVIDSSSSDDTVAIAGDHGARTIVIDRKDFDHGGTRNLGVRISSGDPLIFLTQDVLPIDERVIEKLLGPLQSPDVTLCYGRQTARPGVNPVERFARSFNYPEGAFVRRMEDIRPLGVRAFFCSNVCSAARRPEFEAVGGFPEGIIMNEDMVLAAKMLRAGYGVAYEPRAMVYHSHNYSLGDQFKRYFDIGVALKQSGLAAGVKGAEGEGLRYLREQTAYLAKEREWGWIFYAFAESLVKYSGFRLGFLENLIPHHLKVLLSMNAGFWARRS